MKTSSTLLNAAAASEPVAGDSVLMTVPGALALIVLVMVALAWLARRSGITRRFNDGRHEINVVSSRSLGSRERVVLVDVQGSRLVLGVTASQITCLATLEKTDTPETQAPAPAAVDFPAVLQKLRQKYRKDSL
jgi:flagellar protein FliO/FliZ